MNTVSSSPVQVVAARSTNNVITKVEILSQTQLQAQLVSLSKHGSGAAASMMGLVSTNSNNMLLMASLSALLQDSSLSASELNQGLVRLMVQMEGIGQDSSLTNQFPGLKNLAGWLSGEMNRSNLATTNSELFNKSSRLLNTLQKGQIGGRTQQLLQDVLQQMRSTGRITMDQPQSEQLNKLLQQVRKEFAGVQADPVIAKQIVEFSARLNSHLAAEESALQVLNSWQSVRERHHNQQQGQQQQSQQNEDEDDNENTVSGITDRSVMSVARSALNGSSIDNPLNDSSALSSRSVNNAGINSTSVNINYTQQARSSANSGLRSVMGDNVFSGGLNTLYLFMQILSEQANGSYSEMERRSGLSSDAQKCATDVDQLIAQLMAGGNNKDEKELPKNVIDFINENRIEIKDVAYYDDKGKWIGPEANGSTDNNSKYNQADLSAIKVSLENYASRSSDFVSQSQLQLQKMMQTYNVCVSLINSLQTMLADMNKTIAQGIR